MGKKAAAFNINPDFDGTADIIKALLTSSFRPRSVVPIPTLPELELLIRQDRLCFIER